MNRGDAIVFCTLETGIFGLISEGQLIVPDQENQVEKENTFKKIFFPKTFRSQIQILRMKYLKEKKVPCFCKCEINSIY
jgi:hypothetical protein